VDRIQDDTGAPTVENTRPPGRDPDAPTLMRPGEHAGPSPMPTPTDVNTDRLVNLIHTVGQQAGGVTHPTGKQRLIHAIMDVAPVVAGAIGGGAAGATGAGQGVLEQRGIERNQAQEMRKEGMANQRSLMQEVMANQRNEATLRGQDLQGERLAQTLAGRANVAGANVQGRSDLDLQKAGEASVLEGQRQDGRESLANQVASSKPAPTKTVMRGGKPTIMEWNPATKNYNKPVGEAPPPASASSAFANTRTVNLIDPETTLPTVYQYDPATKSYTKKVGTSATGAYGHEMAQAGAVERTGAELISQLSDPANREILGKLSSYVKQGTLGTPLADQKAAYLSAQLKTFAALQPAMHGFRSRSAQEAFEKIIGGLAQNPDATIGAIQGILKTAKNISPAQGKPPSPDTSGGFARWKSSKVAGAP
jgi:hypothetical protein